MLAMLSECGGGGEGGGGPIFWPGLNRPVGIMAGVKSL